MFLQLDSIPVVPADTTVLDLRFNEISELSAGGLRSLTQLNTLLLNNNLLKRLNNGSFDGLAQLRYLYLYKNQIATIETGAFSGLQQLEQLYLHFNELTEILPGTFDGLNSLERLFLHNNKLRHLQQGTLENLSALARLRLDSNALVCDCGMVWLTDMLKDGHLQAAITCHEPAYMAGKSLTNILNDIRCRKPELTTRPQDVEVSFGNTAYFTCRAEGDPQPDIVWYRNNAEIQPTSAGRYSVLEDGTLMIESARDTDEGFYECVARNELGETKAQPVELRYLDDSRPVRPRINKKPVDVSLGEGESATLECQVTGSPRPTVLWLKNDQSLPSDPRLRVDLTGTLRIVDLKPADTAVYRCVASNSLGTVSEFARIDVQAAPQFVRRPQDQRVVEGSTVFFTCDVTSEPPLPTIHWVKDGRPVKSDASRVTINPSGTTLTVGLVTSQDAGVYDCVAESPGGKRSASARLIVSAQVPPVVRRAPRDTEAPAGTTVRLECQVSGDPRPAVRWHRDGIPAPLTPSGKYDVTHDGSVLVINDVTRQDDGQYECVAANIAGTTRSVARLTVWDTRFNPPSNSHISQAASDAARRVSTAVTNTQRDLRGNPRTPRTAEDLMRLVRYPPAHAQSIGRSAEIFEETLQALLTEVNAGYQYRLNQSAEVTYQELLTPTQLALVSSLSGCQEHRQIVKCDDMCYHLRYRTLDGTCNNLRQPMLGSSFSTLLRLQPARYENNFNLPLGWNAERVYNGHRLPSARAVSLGVVNSPRVSSDETFSHMLMQWGQFMDHDLDFIPTAVAHARFSDGRFCNETCDASGPCFPIPVAQDDPRIRRRRCIGFVRSSAMCGSGSTSVFFNGVIQREQMNALTSYIDASMIYGSTEADARNLRDFASSHGLLRTSQPRFPAQKSFLPPNQGEFVDCQMDANTAHVPCFQAGDHRANEQLGLLTMHTLWVREHNRLATELLAVNPHWDSDTVYHETRKIVGAMVQHITYTQWLPKVLGATGMKLIGPYTGYDPNVDTRVATEFASAAYRFGHTLVQPLIMRLNESFQPIPEGNLPLHRAFFAPFRLVEEGGVDPIIRGLIGQPAKRVKSGEFLNIELTERLFTLAHEVALDLAALNIQRGRDHGLQSYNEYRKHCGLRAARTFDDFRTEIRNDDIIRKLQNVYGHPDNVDLFVGGIAEDVVEGARMGPTFMCIIADQFKRLRDGDRFWYENPDVFTMNQLVEIRQVTLGRVICDNSDSIRQVPRDVFVLETSLPEGQVSCNKLPRLDVSVWAKCCQDCARSGDFRSITHQLRTRRSVDQSEAMDSEERAAEGQSQVRSTRERRSAESNVTETAGSEGRLMEEMMEMSQKMMDAVDVRIEGMEDMMNRLLATVDKLNRKMKKLEKSMPLDTNKQSQATTSTGSSKQASCLDHKGRIKSDGATWKEHDCRSCTCTNGEVVCSVETCPLPACTQPTKVPGQCCPVCQPAA